MKRFMALGVLLLLAAGVAFLIPKPEYTSLNVLEELDIPKHFSGWTSQDVAHELNLKDERYNFISDIFARLYENEQGQQLLFLILDAGNFHNPRICYNSSGFSVRDLGTVPMKMGTRTIEANALIMERQNLSVHMFYWLCIDQKIVDWTGQKILEFWASLFNKKKAGLMVRLEIYSQNISSEEAQQLGRQFIRDLNGHLPERQKEYLFGTL
jgi:EpsI family protein